MGARGDGVGYGPTRQGEWEGRRCQRRRGRGVNRPSRGENPAAGGFNGDSLPVTRFLGNGQVP
jgi:hypothetical protein